MFDSIARPVKDRVLTPIARTAARFISPNGATWLAFAFGIASTAAILLGNSALALLFWLLNRFVDGLDGSIARVSNRQSDFGGYLDIMLDFVIYAAIPLALVLAQPSQERWQSLAVMLALFYVNGASWMYLSALLEKGAVKKADTLTSISMPAGIIEGSETVILFTLFFLLPSHVTLLMYIMSAALIPGIIARLLWARRRL